MKKDKTEKSPIVLKTVHEESQKRWKVSFVLMNLFYMATLLSMGWLFIQEQKAKDLIVLQKQELKTLKAKESIYLILRNRGVSLGQGLDIANVTIRQSRELNLSLSLILAVMKQETLFTSDVHSSQNAVGIMQVHPITWDEYVGKLNLRATARAAFDPVTSTIVATHVLKDLCDHYKKTARSEGELWKSVLDAYYTGMTSLSQAGMTESHSIYVADVNRFRKEFNEKLQN